MSDILNTLLSTTPLHKWTSPTPPSQEHLHNAQHTAREYQQLLQALPQQLKNIVPNQLPPLQPHHNHLSRCKLKATCKTRVQSYSTNRSREPTLLARDTRMRTAISHNMYLTHAHSNMTHAITTIYSYCCLTRLTVWNSRQTSASKRCSEALYHRGKCNSFKRKLHNGDLHQFNASF